MALTDLPPLLRDEPGLTRALDEPDARLAIVEVARPISIAALAHLSGRHPLVVACPTGTMAGQLADDLRQYVGEIVSFSSDAHSCSSPASAVVSMIYRVDVVVVPVDCGRVAETLGITGFRCPQPLSIDRWMSTTSGGVSPCVWTSIRLSSAAG